jgi:ammonium transporter, Amt family
VTLLAASPLPPATAALCLCAIFLVPFALAGVVLVNTGLCRSHSAAHTLVASLAALAVAALVFFICGAAWEGYFGAPAHTMMVAGKPWNLIGAGSFFLRDFDFSNIPASLALWLQVLTVGLAALIPIGAGFDRWRLSAVCASTALLAGLTYPLFAHWVWGGGWLAQLGANYGLGYGFVDAGGAASIHTLGGLTALSIAWIVGPRRGKYTPDGIPTAIPGHSAVLVLLGCLLAWIGWLGLNTAGAILFAGGDAVRAVPIALNTTLSAAAAGLAAASVTRLRFGRPDVSIAANGWVGGLVASSATCAFVPPAEAVLIGLVVGILVPFAVEWFELRLGVDDPGGAISVHALGGLWGLLALGLFGRLPAEMPAGGGDAGQWLAQLVGIATLLGFVLPLTYGLNWALNFVCPHRVAPEGERQGLDLYELGAGAYPEFVTHTDDFTQR